jgi:hypothetical protein
MFVSFPVDIHVEEISLEQAKTLAVDTMSAVGHADTAKVFGSVLGVEIPANRTTVVLKKDDQALVGQYIGPRLSEGITTLPEGATIKWLLATIG